MKRVIKYKTKGKNLGYITSFVKPGHLAEEIKPFIFLNDLNAPANTPKGLFSWHPHSGIATVSVLLQGELWAEETTGQRYNLKEGSLEVMVSGGGVWHTGDLYDYETKGYQIWVALPPELEEIEAVSYYLQKEDIPSVENTRVLLGSYKDARSKVRQLHNLSLLDVQIEKGASWTFTPPEKHDVLWVAVYEGELDANSILSKGEVIIYEESNLPVNFKANTKSRIIVGSAVKSKDAIIASRSSVHTNEAALKRSQERIQNKYEELKKEGIVK